MTARDPAQELPADQWQRLSAGEGSQGPRLYDWGRASIRPGSEPDQNHWLLARRSIADPDDLAYYAGFSPANAALAELVRAAGQRWVVEDAFKEAKREVGLDDYEVRWARPTCRLMRSYGASGCGKANWPWCRSTGPALVDASSPSRGEQVSCCSALCLEIGEVAALELAGNHNSATSAAFRRALRAQHA